MIIYFSAPSRAIKDDIITYKRIVHAIRGSGHLLSCDWTETALLRADTAWDPTVVAEALAAIERSDLLIAEASEKSSFGVGYEVAFALQRRKPILLLVDKKSNKTAYATGLRDDLLHIETYDDDLVDSIVRDFITENEIKTKDLRFNFVIDRKIYNHLRLKSFKSGKTKAEVVRDLLLEDIGKEEKQGS